jgi:PIN domain nuclease of toxin-antitoxin system
VASVWELVIKLPTGKLRLPEPPEEFIVKRVALLSMEALPVNLKHALRLYELPPYHKDPFDRILVA